MFDGSFKSKRTINLGGNKQQIDKQKLLRQAQEERRIREAERLRLKSAERIQVLNLLNLTFQEETHERSTCPDAFDYLVTA